MTSPRMRDTSHCEVTSQHFIKLHWQFATDPTPTGWKEVLWEFSALHKNTKLHNLRSFPLRLRQKQFSEILLTVLGKSYLFTTYFFWSLWIGMDIPNIYMKINTYIFRLLHLYAMFEIWLSIHVPCFHIRQKPLQSWNASHQSNAIHISNRNFLQNGGEIRQFFIKIFQTSSKIQFVE